MLVRHQMRGQSGCVADGGPHQAAPAQPLDDTMPVHLAVTEANLQQSRGDAMCREQQRIPQLINGPGDEAGAEPVRKSRRQ